ncbi:hypothetical protein MIR68_009077 [Amoeboaphelidium protococcarum]|nr:hypothetical protein MIR68_009077 [Amoeboaphelidium protococcarum]
MAVEGPKFDKIDEKVINTVRTLSADMVFKANSGHPGAPMGLAPLAHVLYSRFMKFNPKNSHWFNRDRFVLSNGHACALQYSLLHLYGYNLSLDDIKQFRQLDSKTPGHPEVHHTDGIEVTTGPLGQGIANAVGMAVASHHLNAHFSRPGYEKLVDNYIYCIVGDGCLQEGVASEACALAGHLGLGRLIVLYDDNHIQIDGSTDLAFTEDVLQRFESYGWHTLYVEDGDKDLAGIYSAIETAKGVHDKPSIIRIKTTIGFGSKLQGTEKVHGAPLKEDDLQSVKKAFGFDPSQNFTVPEDVQKFMQSYTERGQQLESEWNKLFDKFKGEHKDLAAEFERRVAGKLPDGWKDNLPKYDAKSGAIATRKTSENVLNAIGDLLPELIGGSADLTHSNLTKWKSAQEFQKDGSKLGTFGGRYLRFGVREHGMAAMLNGIAAYGGLIPFGATFLNFIGYAQGAFRLSALSHFRVLYIMTHDSIGLGEDGPTHQPIEILPLLRATPNAWSIRPCDGNETNGAYVAALETHHDGPTVLCLSRQNLPQLEGTSVDGVLHGAYVLKDTKGSDAAGGKVDVAIVGTGSEVSLCMETAQLLTEKHNLNVRVISMPCWEAFELQNLAHKKSVFPVNVPVLSVEAYSTMGWERYSHAQVGLHQFGASAPYQQIYKQVGLVPEVVAEKVLKLVNHYKARAVPCLLEKII